MRLIGCQEGLLVVIAFVVRDGVVDGDGLEDLARILRRRRQPHLRQMAKDHLQAGDGYLLTAHRYLAPRHGPTAGAGGSIVAAFPDLAGFLQHLVHGRGDGLGDHPDGLAVHLAPLA